MKKTVLKTLDIREGRTVTPEEQETNEVNPMITLVYGFKKVSRL